MTNPISKKSLLWASGILAITTLVLSFFINSEPKPEPFLRFKDYKVLAEGGDTKSQWILGRYFYSGVDVPQDLALSTYWFRKAAEKNYPDACYDLGTHYWDGIGVEKSHVHAAFWLLKAACIADSYIAGKAQIALGDIYSRGGHGLEKDWLEAYAWYAIASRSSGQTVKKSAEDKLISWGKYLVQGDEYPLAHARLENLERRIDRMKIDDQLFVRINGENSRK